MHERSSSEPGNQTRGELGANSGMPSHSRTKIVVSVDATLAQKLKQMEKGAKIDEDTLSGLKELEIGKLKPLPSNSKNPVLRASDLSDPLKSLSWHRLLLGSPMA